MKSRKHIIKLLFLGVFLICSGPLTFAEVVVLRNGKMVAGTIKEATDTYVRISLQSGRATSRIEYDEMTPESAYRVRTEHLDQSTAQDHLELGRFARENHLYARAREQFQLARSKAEQQVVTEEAEQLLSSLDDREASYLLKKARQLEEEGALKEAVETYQKLQVEFADTEQAEKAGEEVKRLSKKIAAQIKQEQQRQKQQQQQAQKKQRQQYRAKVEKNLSLARDLLSEALSMEAKSEYKAAFGRYDRVDEILKNVRASLRQKFDFVKPDQVPDVFQELYRDARDLLVRSYTQRANLHGVRVDVHQGLKWVNRALAIKPAHEQARKLKHIFTQHLLNQTLNIYTNPY